MSAIRRFRLSVGRAFRPGAPKEEYRPSRNYSLHHLSVLAGQPSLPCSVTEPPTLRKTTVSGIGGSHSAPSADIQPAPGRRHSAERPM